MTDMTADDPGAPVFFLSYSRSKRPLTVGPPREPNHVINLFDELSELVDELIGSPVGGQPGYLDLGRGGGEIWQRAVLEAAGTCQVLVCLVSNRFLYQSLWCPREWDVFSRRKVVPRSGPRPHNETAIVPVLWTPVDIDKLPEPIARVNLFQPTGLPPEHLTRYLNEGLLGLLHTDQIAIYKSIVWKLALHIRSIHSRYHVEPGIPESIEGLRTSFTEGTP
ncbi:hypothetical protein AB0C07_30285 [Actinoplanes missouriensis]|uniref:hypothetical protein n=1 Tax=Actinoplanes missouriensis TaxID=1866 RepID=UPI0033E7B1B1